MATVTKNIATGPDYRIEIDYDSSSLRMTALRCINNSSSPVYANAARISDGLSYDHTFPANTTQYINIPTGAAQRLQLTLTSSGKLDGVDYHIWQ